MLAPVIAAVTSVSSPKLSNWAAGGGSPLADVGHLMLSLLVVVALIFATAWFFKWVRGIGPSGVNPLHVVGHLTLGRKERVVLIEAGDKQLLLGVSPGRIETLHVLDEPIEIPTERATPQKFGEILQMLRSRRNQQ